MRDVTGRENQKCNMSFDTGIIEVTQLAGAFETLASVTAVHSNCLLPTGFRDLPNGIFRGLLYAPIFMDPGNKRNHRWIKRRLV